MLDALLRSLDGGYFVTVKMGIEGAELRVIRHLWEQNMGNRIDRLFIEWHERLLPDETLESRVFLEESLRRQGARSPPGK